MHLSSEMPSRRPRHFSGFILFLLSGCYLDCLGHCQDLFPTRFVVMSCLRVLFEVFYKFVIGIGPYSEATGGAGDFFRRVCSNSQNTVCRFNTLHRQLLNDENRSGNSCKVAVIYFSRQPKGCLDSAQSMLAMSSRWNITAGNLT